MSKVLMSGNEAAVEAAIRAGVDCYFGYPITPQNETDRLHGPPHAGSGRRVHPGRERTRRDQHVLRRGGDRPRTMTSSSSPGISLKQEGISYCAGAELPVVIVNVMRGGPGLGNIEPPRATTSRPPRAADTAITASSCSPRTAWRNSRDLVMLAFDLADLYRMPVMVLADGQLGQMMEPVAFAPAAAREPAAEGPGR